MTENRIQSYVHTRARLTPRQREALENLWPHYGVDAVVAGEEPLDLERLFGCKAPCIFEIGFGMGASLLQMAQTNPACNFLGVDVYRPGVGALLADIHDSGISNLRVFCDDAWEVLLHSIAPNSLHRIQIFFPDPWPKRRHHKRRLINSAFLDLAADKLEPGGCLHVATDWEDYAKSILKTLEASPHFDNVAGCGNFSPRPDYRVPTKYEKRGQRLGHPVWDLVFIIV